MNVVQISEHFVFRFQSFVHSAQRIVDAKTEEQWHQQISVFSSLGLTDPVLRPSVIGPHLRCGLGAKRPHEWEQSSKSGHLMQFCEKIASENVIVRSHAVLCCLSDAIGSCPGQKGKLKWSTHCLHFFAELPSECASNKPTKKMCPLRFLAPRRLSSAVPSLQNIATENPALQHRQDRRGQS